jgi:hypothetical protein
MIDCWIAIAPNTRQYGVRGAEDDWRNPSSGRAAARYKAMPLVDALTAEYETDAHAVAYVFRDADGQLLPLQPRVNKGGLEFVESLGYRVECSVFLADVDNPGHARWNDALVAEALEQHAALPLLNTTGVYFTMHGRRIVQPLERAIPVRDFEAALHAWHAQLIQGGVRVDTSCRDWTRHYRLAHVMRGGAFTRAPHFDLSRMRAIAPPAVVPLALGGASTPARSPRERSTDASPDVATLPKAHDLAADLEVAAHEIAAAVREGAPDRRHEMYLALSGALLARGVATRSLPRLVEYVAELAGAEAPSDKRRAASDTASRWLQGKPTTGYASLRSNWPLVADALTAVPLRVGAGGAVHAVVTSTGSLPPSEEPSAALPEAGTADDGLAVIEAHLAAPPDGLSIVAAECGIGKTHAAVRAAIARAKSASVEESEETLKAAPVYTKTSISFDKNALAEEALRTIRRGHHRALRVFGPLSLKRPDGEPVCIYHDVAAPLVAGGQPIQRDFCDGRGEPCPEYTSCRARLAVEGTSPSFITLGSHALLKRLSQDAGTTGLLVIDEPPPAYEHLVLDREAFANILDHLPRFEAPYWLRMAPIVHALSVWLEMASVETALRVRDVVEITAARVPSDVLHFALLSGIGSDTPPAERVMLAVERALSTKRAVEGPPVPQHELALARKSRKYARELGRASAALLAIHRACNIDEDVTVRVDSFGGKRELVLTYPNLDFWEVLRRSGSVIVLDANARANLGTYEKIVGYKPPVISVTARDNVPLARTMFVEEGCTRRRWLEGRRPRLVPSLVNAVDAAIRWAEAGLGRESLAIITFQPIEQLLRAVWHALGRTETPPKEPVDETLLKEALEKIAPILQRRTGALILEHFGAVRGLNHMKDVEALVTLGDPWPNLSQAGAVADLQQSDMSEDARYRCIAELEQAHGRLRAVRRSAPARALHVGMVLPGGYGWQQRDVTLMPLASALRALRASLTHEQFRDIVTRVGTMNDVAATIGCSRHMLRRYMLGLSAIPERVITTVLEADALARDRDRAHLLA